MFRKLASAKSLRSVVPSAREKKNPVFSLTCQQRRNVSCMLKLEIIIQLQHLFKTILHICLVTTSSAKPGSTIGLASFNDSLVATQSAATKPLSRQGRVH